MTRNVTPPFRVSERAVKLVRERNELDLELYRFTSDLFAEQLRRQSGSFGLEVSACKALRPLSRAAAGSTERVLRKLLRRRALREGSR